MTDRQKELEAVKYSRTWLFMTAHCNEFVLNVWTRIGQYYEFHIIKVGNDFVEQTTEKQ